MHPYDIQEPTCFMHLTPQHEYCENSVDKDKDVIKKNIVWFSIPAYPKIKSPKALY